MERIPATTLIEDIGVKSPVVQQDSDETTHQVGRCKSEREHIRNIPEGRNAI
jgi:hypothetical protein